MTVSAEQSRSTLVASGATAQFDFPFPYLETADIRVFQKLASGVESELGPSAFAVTNPGGTGGRVTLSALPVAGTVLNIVRDPKLVQEIDLQENTSFYLETIERAFDRQTMISQRLLDRVTRALVLGDADVLGAGSYRANGNRISGLADGVAGTDAVTLGQVQSLIGTGGGGTGGGGTPTWPTTPPPSSVVTAIVNDPALLALFAPLNVQVGNLAASVLSLNSQNAGFATSIGTINTTISSMQADIDLLEQLQGDGTEIVTLISTETSQRIDGDAAIASVIAKIGAADADGISFLLNTSTAKVGANETLAQRFSGITASIASAVASVATEQTARVNADGVLASTIGKIGALSGDGQAFIFDLTTAMVGPTETFGQRLSAIASAVNGANAAITTEQSTRAAADTSLAATISTLQSSVSGYNVAIQANATAINGVQARYSVKVDNNGRVSGFGLISELNNGAVVSSFNFLADVFRIYNGTTDLPPFTVSGGVVQMQNVQVNGSLLVDGTITAAKIGASQVTADKVAAGAITTEKMSVLSGGGQSIDAQNGRITWTNGAVMKVVGIGFGSSSQFIEWFGPYFASLASCTEANATSYLKTDGSAYFGGALSAGTLFSSIQTTNQASDAEVTLGPYGSNGGSIGVVLSYTYSSSRSFAEAGTASGSDAISASVQLYRTIGAGSETLVATLPISGLWTWEKEEGTRFESQSMGGSTTYTDTAATTSTRTYRAVIASRTLQFTGGTGVSQIIGITSTE